MLSRAEAQARYPALRPLPITGAAVWSDYVTTDADRLTLAWALEASAHGATLANYVGVTRLSLDGAALEASATDGATDAPLRIRATTVVNATGGSLNQLLEPFGAQATLPLLQAVNLVTRLDGPPAAIGGRSASGRNLFLVPWKGRALFGTWESPATCGPGDTTISPAHLDSFITELNRALSDIRRVLL